MQVQHHKLTCSARMLPCTSSEGSVTQGTRKVLPSSPMRVVFLCPSSACTLQNMARSRGAVRLQTCIETVMSASSVTHGTRRVLPRSPMRVVLLCPSSAWTLHRQQWGEHVLPVRLPAGLACRAGQKGKRSTAVLATLGVVSCAAALTLARLAVRVQCIPTRAQATHLG